MDLTPRQFKVLSGLYTAHLLSKEGFARLYRSASEMDEELEFLILQGLAEHQLHHHSLPWQITPKGIAFFKDLTS